MKNDILNNIQVYFTKESGLCDINVNSKLVDEILIEDSFIKIHDKYEKLLAQLQFEICYKFSCTGRKRTWSEQTLMQKLIL